MVNLEVYSDPTESQRLNLVTLIMAICWVSQHQSHSISAYHFYTSVVSYRRNHFILKTGAVRGEEMNHCG